MSVNHFPSTTGATWSATTPATSAPFHQLLGARPSLTLLLDLLVFLSPKVAPLAWLLSDHSIAANPARQPGPQPAQSELEAQARSCLVVMASRGAGRTWGAPSDGRAGRRKAPSARLLARHRAEEQHSRCKVREMCKACCGCAVELVGVFVSARAQKLVVGDKMLASAQSWPPRRAIENSRAAREVLRRAMQIDTHSTSRAKIR